MAHTCPECDTELSLDTATISGGNGGELTESDIVHILAQGGNQMQNIILSCDRCNWSITRTITVRSHN